MCAHLCKVCILCMRMLCSDIVVDCSCSINARLKQIWILDKRHVSPYKAAPEPKSAYKTIISAYTHRNKSKELPWRVPHGFCLDCPSEVLQVFRQRLRRHVMPSHDAVSPSSLHFCTASKKSSKAWSGSPDLAI